MEETLSIVGNPEHRSGGQLFLSLFLSFLTCIWCSPCSYSYSVFLFSCCSCSYPSFTGGGSLQHRPSDQKLRRLLPHRGSRRTNLPRRYAATPPPHDQHLRPSRLPRSPTPLPPPSTSRRAFGNPQTTPDTTHGKPVPHGHINTSILPPGHRKARGTAPVRTRVR